MNIHRSCRLALAFACALLAPRLFAGEIVLFEGEFFQGERIAFGDGVPNLDWTGFNDRTASISVRDGTWEICYHADFQGPCMQLAPGDYPRLDPVFERSISSVRQVGGPAYGGGAYGSPAYGGGAYGSPAYGGGYQATMPSPVVSLMFQLLGVSIGINVPAYPALVPIPGYPVYYAPQLSSNYFFYDGMYWVYQQDNWYASSWYNGPWGLVAPEAVPLFVLRIPVRYYRQPPRYFQGWHAEAPPRWGELWGDSWTQNHRGWENWNRKAAPARAPLPSYQRQYSGNRYPAATQQRTLHSQQYRYQPQDAAVRQHFQPQPGVSPTPRAQPAQQGSREAQRPAAKAPTQPRAAPAPSRQAAPAASQPQQQPRRPAARPAQPAPKAQGTGQTPAPKQAPGGEPRGGELRR